MMTVFASSDGVNYTVVEPTAASTLPQSKGRDQSDSASSGKTPFSKDSTRNSRSTASSTAMQRTGAANSHGASARTTSGLLLQNEDAAKDPTVAADLSVAYSGVEIMKQTVSKLALRVEQLEEGQAALRHAAHEWQCKFEEATSSNHQLRNQLDHLERSIAASNAIGNVTSQTVLTDITSRRPQSQGRTALKSSPVSASNLALLNAVEELRRKNISSEIQLDGIHQRGSCSITTVGDISNCNGAQHTPLSSNSSVGSRGVVEAVGASLANGCDALLEQLKRVEEELKRGCSAGDGFQGGDQSLESVIHEHREAVIALQRSVEDVVNHRHLAIESCESSVSTARTVEDFDKISGILTFEMERGSRLRSFIPTFSLLAMAVDRLQMVTLKPSE
uniref:Uncharacterized protein TCIL3000_11_15450 n=1 Tax=Trypanosoma congolense (strain IL3000) TaxID=1068625 RepID=G0V305_TRYCI|nr:unnamed protein product [Trypanosoma congolense IL3000]